MSLLLLFHRTVLAAASATGANAVSASAQVQPAATVQGVSVVTATVQVRPAATVVDMPTVTANIREQPAVAVTGVSMITAAANEEPSVQVIGVSVVTAAAQVQSAATVVDVSLVIADNTQPTPPPVAQQPLGIVFMPEEPDVRMPAYHLGQADGELVLHGVARGRIIRLRRVRLETALPLAARAIGHQVRAPRIGRASAAFTIEHQSRGTRSPENQDELLAVIGALVDA